MSTFRTPVGPQPPNVYWRRRLVVGIGIVVVIVVVLLIVFAPKGGDKPAAKPVDTNSSSQVKNSSSPAPSGDVPACSPSDLEVTAIVNKPSFTIEETPQLSFKLTNHGAATCAATAGSDVQVFTITSGKETIWTSTDCQKDPVASVATIKAGGEVSSSAIPWDRTRSSKTTCDDQRTPVTANGASYHLTVTVNKITSKTSPQFSLK